DAVFKKSPSDLEGHLLRGRVHLAKGEATAAIEDFQKVVKIEPRLAQARYQLALAHLQAGNLQQAGVELKESTTYDPNFTDAALALAPGYSEPLAQLVALAFAEKQPDAALDRMKKQIALAPNTAALHDLLGTAHQARGEMGPAEAAYLKALELEPRLARTYF